MNKYYAVSFGAPPALANSTNPPAGVIVHTAIGIRTPARSRHQTFAENKGFRNGYIRMVNAKNFEKKYRIEGDYFYKI